MHKFFKNGNVIGCVLFPCKCSFEQSWPPSGIKGGRVVQMSGIVRIQEIPLALLQIQHFHGQAHFNGLGMISYFIRNPENCTFFTFVRLMVFCSQISPFSLFSHPGLWIFETLTCQQKPHIRLQFLQLPQVDRWKPEQLDPQ